MSCYSKADTEFLCVQSDHMNTHNKSESLKEFDLEYQTYGSGDYSVWFIMFDIHMLIKIIKFEVHGRDFHQKIARNL